MVLYSVADDVAAGSVGEILPTSRNCTSGPSRLILVDRPTALEALRAEPGVIQRFQEFSPGVSIPGFVETSPQGSRPDLGRLSCAQCAAIAAIRSQCRRDACRGDPSYRLACPRRRSNSIVTTSATSIPSARRTATRKGSRKVSSLGNRAVSNVVPPIRAVTGT